RNRGPALFHLFAYRRDDVHRRGVHRADALPRVLRDAGVLRRRCRAWDRVEKCREGVRLGLLGFFRRHGRRLGLRLRLGDGLWERFRVWAHGRRGNRRGLGVIVWRGRRGRGLWRRGRGWGRLGRRALDGRRDIVLVGDG